MKKLRTKEQINKEIQEAIAARTRFIIEAREEKDKDYRMGYYNNIDNCNNIIDELVIERNNLSRVIS